MTSVGNATPLVCVVVLILALVVPPAAQQGGACPPTDCPQNTVSVGVLIGSCVAVLVGTLIFEAIAILCYRKYCRDREKPPKVAHRFMISPDQELVVKENLGYESDSDVQERSLREAKERKRASIFNISETKDNMMYVPALYRNPISKDRDTGTAIMNGYHGYEPDYGMDNMFTYNAGWGSRVPNILSGKGNANSLESLYTDADEYPILQTPQGVGPVNFASSKFRDGFGRKSIDIHEDDGDVTTYTYTTGFGGKVRREVATVTTEADDDVEIKGDRVTWRKSKLPDEVVLDMDEEEAKPETRITIDDNFTIGKPTSTRRQGYTTAEVHSDSPGTSHDPSGNFILRATPSTSRSDSSDDDLYDYGDSMERQQQALNMSKHPRPGTIGHGTFRATVGGIPLDHGSSEEESPAELFNSRYRYSTGLNKAKLVAMRAAAAAHAREGILSEEDTTEDPYQDGSPPVMGYIKLVKSDDSTQDGSTEGQEYRVMPTRDSDSPNTVRLYPVNSRRQPITIRTQVPGGFSQDSYIRHRRETYIEVSDAEVQSEIIPRGSRAGQEKTSILRKDRPSYDQEVDSMGDIPTIGVIRLMQPKTSKHVRIREDQTDYSSMTFSEEDLMSASLEDVTSRSTSRSSERTSPRPRRARSAPARSNRVPMQQNNQYPFEEVPTIGVIRLVRPDSASDTSGVDSEVTSGEESVPEGRSHGPRNDKWTQHEVPIVRLAQQILQESVNERASSQRSLHQVGQDMENIPTIGVVRLVRPKSTTGDVRSLRVDERIDEHEERNTQVKSSPVSDMPTIGVIKLLKQDSRKEPNSRLSVSVVDRGTQPANTWAQLLREMHSIVESEILHKTSKTQRDQPTDETLPRTISVIKLKREQVQAQPQVPHNLVDQSTQSGAETRDEATMPTFGWSHLVHEVEDQIETRYKRMSAPAPKDEYEASNSVQKLGVIQLKAAPETILRDSFTQVSGPHTYEKSTGPAWSFKELVEDVEEEAVQKFKKTLKQLDQSTEPQHIHEPVRSVSVIKLKKELGQEKLVRDSVTQHSGPNTYEKSTGPTRTFAEIREDIEEEAVREFKRTLSQLDRPAVVTQDVAQPVRSVSVIKLQKKPEPEKPTVTSSGVQPDLPWRELKEEIEDEAIEEYKKQMRRFQPKEAVQQVPEKQQSPTVSVIKLKGPKTRPAPEKWDNITQCDLIEPKPVMADQVTEPARPWSDVLHNVRRILENEYRRTITELETRLTSFPKDEAAVETVPTVAVFKLKGPDIQVQPEPEKPIMRDENTQAAPRTSEQETVPERPWKNILTDVRKILENEYRRTIRELEDQLSGRDEPDSVKSMALFKLSAPVVPKVQTVSMCTQIDAPQTGDQGTAPERPWGDLIHDVRSSVENEYRVTIRELESQLAERPKDVPKEPTRLGIFKLKGPKQHKVKKPVLHDTFTQPAKPWMTLMSEIEENVERRLSMKKIKPVAEIEPEIVQQTQQMVEMAPPQISPTTADVMTQVSQPKTTSKASQSVTAQRSSISTEANIQPNVAEQSTTCDLRRPGQSEEVQVQPVTAIKSTVTEVVGSSDFFQVFKRDFSTQETQAVPSSTSTATTPQKTSLQEVGIQTRPSTEDLEVITDPVSTSDVSIQVEIKSTPDIPVITPIVMQPVHAPITFKQPELEKIDFAVQVVPEKTNIASATEQRKYVDNCVQVGSPKPTQEVFGVQVQPDVTDGYSSIMIEAKDAGTDTLQIASTEKSTEISIVKELHDLAVQVKPEVKSRVAATDKKKYTDASSQADAPDTADTLESSSQAVPNVSVSFTSMDIPKLTDVFTQLEPLKIQQGDKSTQVNANMSEVGTGTPVASYVDTSSQMNVLTLSQQVQAQPLRADAATGKELATNDISTQPDIATKEHVSVQVSMEIETEPAIIKAVVQNVQHSMPTLPTPAEVADFSNQTTPQTAEFSNQCVPVTSNKYTEKKMDGHSFALQVSQNSTDTSTETVQVVQKTVPVQVRPRAVDKATEYSESRPDSIDMGIQYNIERTEIGINAEPQGIDEGTLMETKLQLDVGTQADCEITVEPAIVQEVMKAPEESVAQMNWDVEKFDADTQTVPEETTQRGTSPVDIKTADAVVQYGPLSNLKDGSVQADPDVTTTGTLAITVDRLVHATQVKPQTTDRGMTTMIRGSTEKSNMANLLQKAYVKPPSKDVSVQIQPVSKLKTQSTLTDKTEVKSMPIQASPTTSVHGQTSRPDVREQWSMTDEAPEKDVIELIIPQVEKPVAAPMPILKAELLDKTTQVILPGTRDMFSLTEISQTQTATQYDHDIDEVSTQTDVEAQPQLTSSSTQMNVHVVDTTAQTIPVKRETIGLSTNVVQLKASVTQYEPDKFKSSASSQTQGLKMCSTGFSPEKIMLKSTGISPEKIDVRTSSTQYQKLATQHSSMQTEELEVPEVIEEAIVSLEKVETLESAPIFPEVELANTETQTDMEVQPIMSDVGSQHEASIKTSVVQTIQVKLESKAMSTTGPQVRESVTQYEPERFRTAVSSQTTVPTRTTGSSTEKVSFKTTGVSPDKVDMKASSTQYQLAISQDNSMQTEDQEEPIPLEEFITVEQAPVVEFMPEFPSVDLADAETQAELVTTDRAILTDPEERKAMKSTDVQTLRPLLKETVVQYEPEQFRMAASSQTTVPTRTTGSSTEKVSFKTTGVSPDKVDVKASSTQYQLAISQDNSMQTEDQEEPIPLEEFITVEQAPVVEFMPEFPSVDLADAETQAEMVTTDRAILTDPEERKAMKSTDVQTLRPLLKETVVQYEPERFRTAVSSQTTVPTRTTGSSTEKVSFKTTGVSPDKVDVKASSTQYQLAISQDNSMQTEDQEEPIPLEEFITVEQAPVVEIMPEFPSVDLADAETQAELVTTDRAILTDPEERKAMKSTDVQTLRPLLKETVVQYEPERFRTAVSSQTTVPTRTTGSSTEKVSFKTTGVSPDKVDVKASSTQYQLAISQDNSMQTEDQEEPIPLEEFITVEQAPVVEFMPELPSVDLADAETQAELVTTDRAILTDPEERKAMKSTDVQTTKLQLESKFTSTLRPLLKETVVQYEPERFRMAASSQTTVPTRTTASSTEKVSFKTTGVSPDKVDVKASSTQYQLAISQDNSMQTEDQEEPIPLEEFITVEQAPVVEFMPELPSVDLADAETQAELVTTDRAILTDPEERKAMKSTDAQTIKLQLESKFTSTLRPLLKETVAQYEPEQFRMAASSQTTVPTRTTGSSTEKVSFKTTGVSPDKVDVKASFTQYQLAISQDNSMQTEDQEEPIPLEEFITVEQAPVVEFMPELPSVDLADAETQAELVTTDRAILTDPEERKAMKSTDVQTTKLQLESKFTSTLRPLLKETVVQYDPERFRMAASSQTAVPTRTTGSSTEKVSFKTTGVSPDKVDVKASSTQYQLAISQDNSMQTEDQEEPIPLEEFITVEQAPVVEFMPEFPSVDLVDAETQAELVTTDRAILTDPEERKAMKSTDVQTTKLQLESKFTSTLRPLLKETVAQYEPEQFRMAASSQTTVPTRTTGSSTEKVSFKTTGVSPDKVDVKASSTQYQLAISQDNSMQTEDQEEPIPLEEFITVEQAPVVEFMPEFPSVDLADAETQAEMVTTDRAILTDPEERKAMKSTDVQTLRPLLKETVAQYEPEQFRMAASSQTTVPTRTTGSSTEKVSFKTTGVSPDKVDVKASSTQYQLAISQDNSMQTEDQEEPIPLEEFITVEQAPVVEFMPEFPSVDLADAETQAELVTTDRAILTDPEERKAMKSTDVQTLRPLLKETVVQYEPEQFRMAASSQTTVPTRTTGSSTEKVSFKTTGVSPDKVDVKASSTQYQLAITQDNSMQTEEREEPIFLEELVTLEHAPVVEFIPEFPPVQLVDVETQAKPITTDRAVLSRPESQEKTTSTFVKKYTQAYVQSVPRMTSVGQQITLQRPQLVSQGTTMMKIQLTSMPTQAQPFTRSFGQMMEPTVNDQWSMTDEEPVEEMITPQVETVVESMSELPVQTQDADVQVEPNTANFAMETQPETAEQGSLVQPETREVPSQMSIHQATVSAQATVKHSTISSQTAEEEKKRMKHSGVQTQQYLVTTSSYVPLKEKNYKSVEHRGDLVGIQPRGPIRTEHKNMQASVSTVTKTSQSTGPEQAETGLQTEETVEVTDMEVQTNPVTIIDFVPVLRDSTVQYEPMYFYSASTQAEIPTMHQYVSAVVQNRNQETTTHTIKVQPSSSQTEAHQGEHNSSQTDPMAEPEPPIAPVRIEPVLFAPPPLLPETHASESQTDSVVSIDKSTTIKLPKVLHSYAQVGPRMQDTNTMTAMKQYAPVAVQSEPDTLSQMMQTSPDVREETTLTEKPVITDQASQHDTASMHVSSQAAPESYDASTSFDLVVQELIEAGTQHIMEMKHFETQTHTDKRDQASCIEIEMQESDCQTELTIEDLEEMLATLKQKLEEKPLVPEFIIPQQLNPVQSPISFPIDTEDTEIQTFLETVQRSTSPILLEVKHAITQYEAELKELGVQVKPDVIDKEIDTFIIQVQDAAIQYATLYGKDKLTQYTPHVNDAGSLTDQKEYQHIHTNTKSVTLVSKTMQANPQNTDKATTPVLQLYDKRATQTSPAETVTRWTQREIQSADAPIQVRPVLDDAVCQTETPIKEEFQAILKPIEKQEVRLEMRSFMTNTVEIQTDPVIIKSAGPDDENESWLDSGIDTDVQTDPVVILSDLDSEIELMDEDCQTLAVDMIDVDIQVETRKEVNDTTSQTSPRPQVTKTVQTMAKQVSYASTITTSPVVKPIASQTFPTKTETKGFQFEPVPYLTNEDIDTQTTIAQTKEQGTHVLESQVESSTTQTDELPYIEPAIIHVANLQPVEAQINMSAPEADVTDTGVQASTEVTDEDSQTARVFTTDRPSSPGISYAVAESQTVSPALRTRNTQYEPNAAQKKTQTEATVTVNMGTTPHQVISQDICLQTFLETKPDIVDRSMQHASVVLTGYSQTDETQHQHEETQTDQVDEEIHFITPSPEFLVAFTQTTEERSHAGAQTEGPRVVQSGTDAPVTKQRVGMTQTLRTSICSEGTVTEPLKSVSLAVQTDAIPVRVVDEHISPVRLQPVHAPLKLPEYKPEVQDVSVQADVKTDDRSMQHDSENTQFNIFSTHVVKGDVKPTVLSEVSMTPQKKHFISHLESSAYPKEETLTYKHVVHAHTQAKPEVYEVPVQVQPIQDDRSTATEERTATSSAVQTDFAEEPMKEVIRVTQVPQQQTPFLDLGPILMDAGTQVKPKTTDHGMSPTEYKPSYLELGPILLDTAAQHDISLENAFSQTVIDQHEKSTYTSVDVRQESSQATTEKKDSGVQAKTPKQFVHARTQVKPDVDHIPVQVQPVQDDQSTATEEPIVTSIEVQTEFAEEPVEEVIRISHVPEQQTPFLDLGAILIDTGTQVEPKTSDRGMTAVDPGPVLLDASAQHEIYIENAFSQTRVDQQEKSTYTKITVRQESSQATTEKRDAEVQAKTAQDISLMTAGIQTVVIHEEKPQMLDMAIQFRPLNTDQATLTRNVGTTSSHSNTEPVSIRQAMVQVAIKPETEARATLTTPKYLRNITTQAETTCYDACVQHDDLPDLADKGLQIKPVMVDDTSETVQSRHIDRLTQVDMDGMKPITADASIQHGEEKDVRDKISQVKPISAEAGVLTEVFTTDKGNQADFAPVVEVDEIIRPNVTEIQHAPIPFPQTMSTDRSTQHQPSVDIQSVQTSIDVSERASSPVGPDYNDTSCQTRTDTSNVGLQTNFQETSTAEIQATMSYFSEDTYEMESVKEDVISSQVVTEEHHMAPVSTVQYQDAQMQYNPTTEDSTTETVSTGIDFASQSQPLTIEQGTTTDITKHSQAEVQVDIGKIPVITHETAVQHERMFKPVDMFTQAHPLTVEEGTSTVPQKKAEVSVQYIAPLDQRPPSPRIVPPTTDKGTSAQYITSQSSTQTILLKSDVSIQSKPSTKSALTHAAIKPDTLDQSTATKPDVRAFETQTFFPKKSESSQCDQTTVVHNTSQYERMFVEDNSVQVKPVIREQANSPIFKRKDVGNASSQTDTVPEDMDSSVEDLIRSAPHQPFKPHADSDFMHDYSDRLREYLDRDKQVPAYVEPPIQENRELPKFAPRQESSSPTWDYSGDFSSHLYDIEMTESIDIIDRLFTSEQSTYEIEEPVVKEEEPIVKEEVKEELSAPKYYIESAVQTGPMQTKERSTSPLFPPTKEAQSQFDKDIGRSDTNVQASPTTASESSYTAQVFSQDVSSQADFDNEEVPTSDAATQHYTIGQDISAQVEPLMTDAGMTFKVDSRPTSTQAKPETLEQGTSTLKQSTPTSDMQTQAKPDAVVKTTSPLAIRKNQMAVQTKVDQRHIPTQYDRVSSADAVVQMSPQSHEKGTSTKPECRDVSINVIPTQRHETTQYEQSIKTMDFMVQYRAQHLDISTQSLDFKAACLDRASSPINIAPDKIQQDTSPITESPIQPVIVQQVSASPTQFQPVSRLDDAVLRQEIRNEIRMEVIHQLREEIREEVRGEIQKNQMEMPRKVDQRHIPTQCDRVSSTDAVVQMSPQSLEKGTTTKPENRDVSINVIPTQRHEITQCEQSIKTKDFMGQYRAHHLDISTQSLDFKAACLDRASSPINIAPEKIQQDTSPITESPIQPVIVQQVSASPTQFQPVSRLDDAVLRQEIRNEIRIEVIHEVRDEIREEVREEIREELQHKVNKRVEMEVRDEMRTELAITVREELREEFIEEYKEEILIEIKEELKVEFESRIRLEFEERTRDDLEFKIRREIEPKVRLDLEPIIRRELEQEYIKETIHEIRAEAPVMYQPSEYKPEPIKPLMLNRGTSPVVKHQHDAPTQVSTVTKDGSSQCDKPSKPVDGITQTKVYTVECGTTPDKVRTSDAPVQAQPSMTHRGTTPSEKLCRDSGIQVIVQKMDKCDQHESKPSQSDVSVQFSHEPQTVGVLCQVQPDTDEQGTSMEVKKLHQTYVQTEEPLVRSENTQTITEQMDAFCQSEPVFRRDTTMQVKPVTFDKGTSTEPQETGDNSTQVELLQQHGTTEKIPVKQQDSSVQYERSMEVTDRRLQAKPVVREQANSPLSFLTFDVISPQRQDPVHLPFYKVQPRESSTERTYITEVITGEKVPPTEHIPPSFTSSTTSEPTSSKFTYSFSDRPSSTFQAKSALEPLVARLDYVPTKSTDLDAIRPTVSKISYRSSYDSMYESSSRFTQDVLQSMPSRCEMILLQTTAAGTTYTSAFRTSTPTTRVSDPYKSLLPRTSILEQEKPVEFTSTITSPTLSDTESDSLPEMSELEKIRRDLRLSRVIVTDDQATLVGYFVNGAGDSQTPDLPDCSPFSTPFSTPEYTHKYVEYSNKAKFSPIPQSSQRGRQHFMNLEHTPTESVPDIIMDDESFPTPTEEGDWFKRETSAYRLNVPYDKKGSPRPGARIVHSLSPSQSPSHTPGRMSPVFLSSEDGHPGELLPIPRGMVTRLSDLLSDGILSDDESLLPISRLSEMIEKHRELSQPPMWSGRSDLPTSTSQDPESEVDTTDSDTDTESFSAVMDFTDPFLHENPNFWRGGPTDFTTSSTNSDVSSDDDDVTVYGDCDVYSFDLPFLASSKPSRALQDTSWMPGEPPRKRHSVVKIDRQRVREELSMSEVVLPDGPPRLTGYMMNVDDGNWQRDRYSNRLSRSEPDLYRSTTSNASVISPPSYSTAYPYTNLGSRRHPAPEQLMVDAGSMPALSAEIRYARLVKKEEISHTQRSQYTRLSHSDPDLASWQEELFDVGHF